ncbi:thiolase [Rozella allomycis CSF55]|uniref:acetyl-CoA C-acyltransferase n=1 Tax=Rozella allomycis (strain CSF55) TaxID=988480 RepID=A0A075AQX7_ROZAC|nr:3-ketoacyl-CoA thiolase A, peroxisomal [Rozella allomycis CSF55]RKP16871.1 thiolase [Rozella allomycis CSF55]|eukprot:EPZ32623.1 3-ketoacyl-CoA thiolase A, peroxisomal [Rozella allomycis CSF55]
MAERLRAIQAQMTGLAKSPDDVVIVSSVRTPICRAKRGPFKDTHQEELLAVVLKAVVEKVGLNKALVDDIIVGNVLPPGGGATISRMAQLYAGFPEKCSIATINRQCSSGLQAIASVAAAIASGQINIGIGAGAESMSMNYGPIAMPQSNSEAVLNNPSSADCLMPMGITSENVASTFGVSREKQDRFAELSHKRAARAQQLGLFNEEIIPVTVKVQDKNGSEKTMTVSKDDGIRADTTFESLSKLRAAFKENGTTTAGNSSQVSDGAAAALLMKRKTAAQLGLPILATFKSFATVGVPPNIMGIGPAFAIPVALEKAGLTVKDIDVFEINEAFASQAVYCVEKLGIDVNKVNPNGGGIALGHPLGCTGARQMATLLPELKRRNGRFGVISMCIGTGMGAAAVIERE